MERRPAWCNSSKCSWEGESRHADAVWATCKRAPLAISIRISSLLKPYAAEHTTTENICSLGLRVLVQEARKRNELMLVNSADGEFYCERIGDGRFALGLEFMCFGGNAKRLSESAPLFQRVGEEVFAERVKLRV